MRIDFGASVIDHSGTPLGHLHEIIIALDSRRVAGFNVLLNEATPRTVFVMVGQVAQVEQDQLTLTISAEEAAALLDAHQHFYVAPEQDIAEIDEAESPAAGAQRPDPDERPVPSSVPGIALTPNLLIPLEIERDIASDEQITFSPRLRVIATDGTDLGHLGGVIVNDEARLMSLVLQGLPTRTIDYTLLDTIDDASGELTLLEAADKGRDTGDLP